MHHFLITAEIYELLTVRLGGPVLEVAAWLGNILLLVYIDSETMGETKVDRSFNTIWYNFSPEQQKFRLSTHYS